MIHRPLLTDEGTLIVFKPFILGSKVGLAHLMPLFLVELVHNCVPGLW